jgi:pimeloyl-ACP methyl ester carboxylesterase
VSRHTTLRVGVADVAPPGCGQCTVDVVAPTVLPAEPTVMFCFPGGGMSRRYFDLAAEGYSFAEWFAARGYVLVLVDHPGVGDSDIPQDGWSLDPSTIAVIEDEIVRRVLRTLRAGDVAGLPKLHPARVVGIGHSMGAGLVIRQQAEHSSFDAVALLGWSSAGLPEHLNEDELAHSERELSVDELVAFARGRSDEPLPLLPRGSSELLMKSAVPPHAHAALVEARSRLLLIAGHSSMIPGVVRSACARIEVPVFIGVGDADIAREPRSLPAQFPRSSGVTLYVLPDAGHNHNVEPTRALLWEQLDNWLRELPSTGAAAESIVNEVP